jgi:hypothetical protein
MLGKTLGLHMGRVHAQHQDAYQAALIAQHAVLQRALDELGAEKARLLEFCNKLMRDHTARPAAGPVPNEHGFVDVGGTLVTTEDLARAERWEASRRELDVELAERAAAELAIEHTARAARARAHRAQHLRDGSLVAADGDHLADVIERAFRAQHGEPTQDEAALFSELRRLT